MGVKCSLKRVNKMDAYKERILKFRKELEEDRENAKFELVYYDDYGNLAVSYELIMDVLEDK